VVRSEQADAKALRFWQRAKLDAENDLRKKAATDGLGEIRTQIDVNVGDEPSP
jgi:hypothetical protein